MVDHSRSDRDGLGHAGLVVRDDLAGGNPRVHIIRRADDAKDGLLPIAARGDLRTLPTKGLVEPVRVVHLRRDERDLVTVLQEHLDDGDDVFRGAIPATSARAARRKRIDELDFGSCHYGTPFVHSCTLKTGHRDRPQADTARTRGGGALRSLLLFSDCFNIKPQL